MNDGTTEQKTAVEWQEIAKMRPHRMLDEGELLACDAGEMVLTTKMTEKGHHAKGQKLYTPFKPDDVRAIRDFTLQLYPLEKPDPAAAFDPLVTTNGIATRDIAKGERVPIPLGYVASFAPAHPMPQSVADYIARLEREVYRNGIKVGTPGQPGTYTYKAEDSACAKACAALVEMRLWILRPARRGSDRVGDICYHRIGATCHGPEPEADPQE